LRARLSGSCAVQPLSDRALVALQGPKAAATLTAFAPEVQAMKFMDVRTVSLCGAACLVSRSGYTGEDGFEISVPAHTAEALWEALLSDPAVAPIGLGARDSLRLEAGLCLYGADLDETTTPVEAALEWTVAKARRNGGERTGGFPGAETILRQLVNGTSRRRVGLQPESRAPVRSGAQLYRKADDVASVGLVTTGCFGPSVNAPIAMGYVPREVATPGTQLFAEVRGKRLLIRVSKLPFIATRYKRH